MTLNERFWDLFNKMRNGKPDYTKIYTSERKPANPGTMDLSFGKPYHPFAQATFRKNEIRAGIWIGNIPNKDAVYDSFEKQKDGINVVMGVEMNFIPGDNSYSIVTSKTVDLNDESRWGEYIDWMMDMCIKLNTVKDRFGI